MVSWSEAELQNHDEQRQQKTGEAEEKQRADGRGRRATCRQSFVGRAVQVGVDAGAGGKSSVGDGHFTWQSTDRGGDGFILDGYLRSCLRTIPSRWATARRRKEKLSKTRQLDRECPPLQSVPLTAEADLDHRCRGPTTDLVTTRPLASAALTTTTTILILAIARIIATLILTPLHMPTDGPRSALATTGAPSPPMPAIMTANSLMTLITTANSLLPPTPAASRSQMKSQRP